MRSLLLRCFAAALALLPKAVWSGGGRDVFRIFDEKSPREAAILWSMAKWANVSEQPWGGRRVVATMTTTPQRIAKIEPALDSLLQQTRAPDTVYLFVPHVFKRDGSSYVLPDWLPSKKGVTVRRCEDLGPATHMLEVLKIERDPDTFILQVDDDQHYGPKLLDSLLRAGGPMPGRAIGAATQHAHTHLGGIVLEGVHGVLFQRRFFDDSVFDYGNYSRSCWLHDDLWLSAHLARKGFRRETLSSRLGTTPLDYGFGEDALYKGGAGSDNMRNLYVCIADLLRRKPRLWVPQDRVVVLAPLLPVSIKGVEEADAALRRLRRLKPRRRFGPAALYLRCPVLPEVVGRPPWERHAAPGGAVWYQLPAAGGGVDLVLQVCGYDCGFSQLLGLALRAEEDPLTILVSLDTPVTASVWGDLRHHVGCIKGKSRSSQEGCQGLRGRGSVSFRRHSVYPEKRIPEGIYLPQFSKNFHSTWGDRALQGTQGLHWRDIGPTWAPASTELEVFERYLREGSLNPSVVAMWQEWEDVPRRIVATFGTTVRRLPLVGRTIRSLLWQRFRLRQTYVWVRGARRKGRRCAPAWLWSRHRVRVYCETRDGPEVPLLGVLAHEVGPHTWVLACDDAHSYRPELVQDFVKASELWGGFVISARGITFGMHGGPVPLVSQGALYRRSWLDTSLQDHYAQGECKGLLSLVVAAHAALQGVGVKVLGRPRARRTQRAVGQRSPGWEGRWTACHKQLTSGRAMLWSSMPKQRAVLYIALLPGTDDFLLDMTLQYAAVQTRKPDEVVLLNVDGGPLDEPPRGWIPSDAEIVFTGRLGAASVEVRSKEGVLADVSTRDILTRLRDKTGCIARVHSSHGGSSNFLLSVASCGDCAVKSALYMSFDREMDPHTGLLFTSAERLVNERLVEENLACLDTCKPYCNPQNWCGQSSNRPDGQLYDFTVRRSAGYRDITDVAR